jgi:hypothetical protein
MTLGDQRCLSHFHADVKVRGDTVEKVRSWKFAGGS